MTDATSDNIVMPGVTPSTEPVILEDPTPEPQAEVTEPEVTEEVTADPSPATAEKPEQKHNATQQRINDITAKKYAEQRRADAAEARVAELEASKPQVIADAPTAPALPTDTYDEAAMAQYHQDMVKFSSDMAIAASKSTFAEQQRVTSANAKQQKAQESINTYASNAVRDGVDLDKLRVVEQDLAQSGLSPQLGQHIMADPNGGLIAQYLYDNPALKAEVIALDPVSAGIKIQTEIKALALSTTPKVSNAPAPVPEITGGGVLEKDDFERKYPGTVFI